MTSSAVTLPSIVPVDFWGTPEDIASDPDHVVTGWGALRRCSYRAVTVAEAVMTMVGLGLHPIVIAGRNPDGTCTCGRRLHDVKSIGKHPVRKNWQTAPLDVRQLLADIEASPRCNIGLRMGLQPNGMRLITIDVDGPPETLLGAFTWDELPPTLVQTTARGFHLIYRLPDGAPTPKNAVAIAPGIDIRSEGGQIVCAPSIHASGKRYHFTRCQEPTVLT